MSEAKSMKRPDIKKELLKILSDLENEGQKIFEQKQEENYKCQKALNDRIADLEAELAVVNLALRNAKNDDWSGMGFELDDEVVDRFSRNAIENARRQLNAEKEQS